jgi:2-amino-4-hydroxy-6-hydroxymethyldihydropteridine diphosphokinase
MNEALLAQAYLALGGNVGNSRAILDRAVFLLCDGKDIRLTARSSDYKTSLEPRDLLARAQSVEMQLGRDRAHEKRWGPRTCDIDVIAYDDIELAELGLTLPHPRLFERGFVLLPLSEIAPDRIIAGRKVSEALAGVDLAGIERLLPFPGP